MNDAPNITIAQPVQNASLYAVSCASAGAFVPFTFTVTPSFAEAFFSSESYTIVVIANPNDAPNCNAHSVLALHHGEG